MTTHLVIPDSHSKPGVSNERYSWLGKLIMEVKPDVIINLGDMADMYSLNSYDRGTTGFQGARYNEDVDTVKEALEELYKPLTKYNKRQAKNKKRGYRPRQILTLGNHENRINRVLSTDERFIGTLSTEDLGYEKYYEVYPFLKRVTIDGVTYAHCVQHKNSGQMVGGQHHANSLLMKYHCSQTVGHSHILDFKTDVTGSGTRMNALVAGCYFEHHESYANESNQGWWRGVIVKRDVSGGNSNMQTISLQSIKEKYS